MKKTSKVFLCIIILLVVVVIGVGGWFLVDSLNKSNNKISELENLVNNSSKRDQASSNNTERENDSTNVNTIEKLNSEDISTTNNDVNSTKKYYSMKDISGKYSWETTYYGDTYGVNLFLANDGTFGCFYEVGGITGSYSIDGNTIVLNEIFGHGGGVGLDVVKSKKTFTINEDGTLTTKDLKSAAPYVPESVTMKKISSDISDFDIRVSIKGSYGSGPEHSVTFNY